VKPILFSGAMVKATLEGRKTQTRRVIKPQPFKPDGTHDIQWKPAGMLCYDDYFRERAPYHCPYGHPPPYGQVGDRLWVRETFSLPERACEQPVWYWADGNPPHGDWTRPKPSIFMPRKASRITLEITGVRVERVQEIDYLGARAEGILVFRSYVKGHPDSPMRYESTAAFMDLWDSINAKRGYGWASNPWTWVLEFKRVEAKR